MENRIWLSEKVNSTVKVNSVVKTEFYIKILKIFDRIVDILFELMIFCETLTKKSENSLKMEDYRL